VFADIAPRPAASPADAAARFATLAAADDDLVMPAARSRFYQQAERARIAVVLVHGFTNNPAQFDRLAPELHALGYAVVVPRLAGHGDIDRRGLRLAAVRADAWLATTNEAIDIACGAGRKVVVAGISLGATIAAMTAIRRGDVARAIAIAPFFGLQRLARLADAAVERVLGIAPNVEVPWDPFGDGALIPPHAYPKFPTRGLGQTLRVGLAVLSASRRSEPACNDLVVLTNERDPAVENRLADAAVAAWNALRPGSASGYRFTDLPKNHDIVDPTNPLQRIELVYPKIVEAVERAP
jgi:carboxylesterase